MRAKPTCDCWELNNTIPDSPFYELKQDGLVCSYLITWDAHNWKYCFHCGVAGEPWPLTPTQGA